MPNKKFVFLSVSFFLFTSAIAQEGNAGLHKAAIMIEPLALADVFDGASLRFGTEFKSAGHFSLAVSGGPYLNYLDATKISPKGFLVKPAIKYYLARNVGLSGRYIALEYEYKNQDYEFKDTMAVDGRRYQKQYAMSREVNCLTFKYGNVRRLGKHFLFEYYGGLGIRYIRSRSSLADPESDAILSGEAGDCPLQDDFIRKTGNLFYPNFVLGVRIGYGL